MKFFYARVSTADQNLARQLKAAEKYKPDQIFSDKSSGKSFDRPEYQKLKAVICAGDELIIKSIDRLGRDRDGIQNELAWFRSHGVIVRIIDIPTTMIEFPAEQQWIGDMVCNILIEVLSCIAQQEREVINKRRQEGIDAMPIVNDHRVSSRTGRSIGRPPCRIDEALFLSLRAQNKAGKLTIHECCQKLSISRGTWYNLCKKIGI